MITAAMRIITNVCTCALIVLMAYSGLAVWADRAGAFEAKPFGVEKFTMQTTEGERLIKTGSAEFSFEKTPNEFSQAGGHPWALTTIVKFTTEFVKLLGEGSSEVPTRDPKDIVTDLPPGLLGDPNPQDFPQCPVKTVLAQEECGVDTQLGVARLRWFGGKTSLAPIVNVVPEKGQSAEFGVETTGTLTALLTAHVVRAGKTYGLAVVSSQIPSSIELAEAEVTFWGIPADHSHDAMRGVFCSGITKIESCGGGGHVSGVRPVPFLTMPTSCASGPESATVKVDSWEEPGEYKSANTTIPGMAGCDRLKFEPDLEVQPDTVLADAPVGLGVNLIVPQAQGNNQNLDTPATPQVRDSVVTLPTGLSVNPGIVDGIQACEQSGPHGINFEGPESEEIGISGESQLAPGHCPDASIVGEAEAESPLLDVPVKGHVYLAKPGCGGAGLRACTEEDSLDGNLYRLYLELGGTGSLADTGVNLKVEGRVEANPATGQLTTVFENTPQLPFSELRIRLNGGPRASLANPAVCGLATTTSRFTPWSAPGVTPPPDNLFMAGTHDATSSSLYDVEGCLSPTPFDPGFLAGTVTPNAAKFSSFTMNLARGDREQYVKSVQVHTPPGLLAKLSSVPLCPEAQANEPGVYGECTASKIGTTRVASGAGSHPFEIEGNVYLTGPYRDAPFGLSIVTHAVAGPFDLGLVVVRARIAIDPGDSTATITTDENGPYAVPQIIFGVPLRLKRITVNIDRPGFMFNPTSCRSQRVTGAIAGQQNSVAEVSSPFAAGGCKSLAFTPKFTVATSARTTRVRGASLDAKLSYPKGAMGTDANIAYVKVSLPKQLPSRLTTLQKACPARTFDSDPGSCDPQSIVGVARTTTPLLRNSLIGPVYFVSHGGEAFPNLVVVLEGEGVRVDLIGETFISKAEITSTTFRTVPDVPVASFELYLPQGRYSALAANGNLCTATHTTLVKKKVLRRVKGLIRHTTITVRKKLVGLVMPTEMVAQNGAVFKQATMIKVGGCSNSKKVKRGK